MLRFTYPNFNVRKAEEYVKRPSETLIHGDFHSGNVMLGEGSNKGIDWYIDFILNEGSSDQCLLWNSGKIVLLDFQTYGSGLVSIDFMHLLYFSQNIQSYDEVEELARGIFHYITNYKWY